MSVKESILLVEGDSDKSFFEALCKDLGLDNSVQVAPPRNLSGRFNSKEGVFNHLPILLHQLNDGSIKRVAIVLDADTPPNGGFTSTENRISEIVAPFKYRPSTQPPLPNSGLIFENSDGLADLGLWVMPDNSSNGMLEDWIKYCVSPNEKSLFECATDSVSRLPLPTKFNLIHRTKAEVATWLAWQKKPGQGLHQTIECDLLDRTDAKYEALTNWLVRIFNKTT